MSKIKKLYIFTKTLIPLIRLYINGNSLLIFSVNTIETEEGKGYSVGYDFKLGDDLNLLHMPELLSCIMEEEAALVSAEEMKDLVKETV